MSFKKIKENLKDPKKKALTQLGLYIIFFIFVFIIFSVGKTYEPIDYEFPKEEVKEENKSLIKYNYEYEINDNENVTIITGNTNEDTFVYNGNEYYNLNNKTYKSFNEEADFYFDPKIYNYENIKKILEKSTFEEKVIHKDLTETVFYKLNAGDYLDSTIETCSSVVDIIVEKKEYINKVSIDLSNCYNYKYIINIKYNSMD